MPTAIVLPKLGVDEPVRVSSWLVDAGDTVEDGDVVVEVLTQGMTFDVAAPAAGILSRIEQAVDSVTCEGDVLGWIEPQSDDPEL